MAIAAVAGLATLGGAALGGLVSSFAVGVGFFALGAGMSIVSRALAPKPNIGAQMRGITQTTREPASSRKIIYGRMRVGGQVVFISHSGDDRKYLHMAIAFATHEIQAYDEIWFNDNKIWDATNGFNDDWGTYVTIDRKFGTAGQAASTDLVNANSRWTTDHKLSGIAYIAFRLEWDQDKFPQGVPNITAVIRGKKVYDPRDQSIGYSQNPALCLRDYMIDQNYGLGEAAANLNDTSISDAADLCDEQVSLDGGGTQDRYQCNGVIDTANQVKANIEQLLSSMGGRLTYSGGEYFVDGAEYQAPTVTFTEADIVSDIQTQTKQSRRGIYNGVKGIFVSEEKNYKVLDYPAQISSTYETEDGDPIYLDMPLPCVTNNTQAQRLAKIALLKSRQQVVMTMTTNLKGLRVKVGDTIQVTNDRLNYSSKVFEVIDYSLAITDGALGVNLSCIETSSALYDWTTSDEADFLSGGELPLYDGRTVDNVTNITFTEVGLRGPDGGVKSAVELSWTAPTDAFIEYYTVRYNKNGTTDYFEVQTRETNALIEGLDITSNYDFTIKAQNLIGVRSAGITLSNRTLNGDETEPGLPTGMGATGGIQTITAEWSNPSDIDFKHVEVFVNTTDSIPATPTAVVDGEEYIVTGLSGASTRYFWLKSVDFSGNKSDATASFSGTSVVAQSADVNLDSGDVGLGNVDNRDPQDQVETGIETGATVTAGGITLSGGGSIKGGQTEYDDADAAGFFLGYSGSAYKFSIGNSDNSKKLTFDGTDLAVTGEITATSGTIGGFTLGSTSLTAGTASNAVGIHTVKGIYLGATTFASSPFRVNTAGEFTATNATITGSITATSLTLSGTSIAESQLATGVQSSLGLADSALQDGDTSVNLGLDDGSIAGISINSTKLYAGTGTWANSNTGFYLDNTGKFSLKDKIFFNPSNNLLTVDGNITADIITAKEGLEVLGTFNASGVAAGGITRAMLSQDALDEIFGALATSVGGSNGDYKDASGSFTTSGGTVTVGTSSDKFDHGTAEVVVEFLANHYFYTTTNYTTAQAQATLNFEVSADGTFTDLTSATKTQTLQFGEYDLSSYYGYTYLVYFFNGEHSKTFTTGSGNDIPDDTELQFRVRVTGVGTAFTSQTVPFTVEANEGVTGVVSTGGNADTLDNLDSTKFLRSDADDTFDADLIITGDLSLQGALNITGDINSYNVTDLDVTDKTITVNSGSTQALSNGAGLIVDRGTAADASITWNETSDEFDFTNGIDVTGPITASGNLVAGNNDNISMDASSEGQVEINGAGYTGAIALDATAMHIYHNSSVRSLILGTNETARLTITGTGAATFSSTVEWSGGGSTNANTAYTYSQVGHLPLSGGTITGTLTTTGVVRSTNNANVDGPNFNVSTTNKSVAEYAYRVDRSGSIVGGIRIDGRLVGPDATIGGTNFGSTQISNWNTAYGWGDHASGGYSDEYKNYGIASGADHDTHHWNKTHAAYSNNLGSPTYIVLTTNVPQDSFSMGGFTLVFQNQYSNSGNDEGDTVTIYGYWNPESNGGFIGFRYHTSNPDCAPTIQVGRNTSGKTVFLISNESGNYAQVVAKDLWLGYAASNADSSWGDSWAFSEASATTGISNLNTLNRVGITATQRTNWNTAYSKKINTISFAAGSGLLTLTRQDSTVATTNLDGRYLTSYTETDTLDSVTNRGATTTNAISIGSLTGAGSNNVYAATFTGATGPSVTSLGLNVKTLDGANDVALLVEKTDGTDLFKITGQGVGSFSQRITVQNQDITGTRIQNWQTAYDWGDHSTAGYLTSYTETDTFSTVTARGNTSATSIAIVNSGPTITLRDSNSTGNAQLGYLSFQDSSSTEKAWIGYGSSSNSIFTIRNSLERIYAHGSYFKASGYVTAPYYIAESGGSAGSPAFRFSNDTDTGIFRLGADKMGLSAGAGHTLTVGNKYIEMGYTSFVHPINSGGWKKLGKIDTRGGGRIVISYTGGSFSPNTYVIDYFKNWSSTGTLKLEQYGNNDYISRVRIRQDSSDNLYYLEIYLSDESASHNPYVYDLRLMGYNGTLTLYSGSNTTLSAGSSSGTDIADAYFVAKGTTMHALRVNEHVGIGVAPSSTEKLKVAGSIATTSGSISSFGNLTASNGKVTASGSSSTLGYWVGTNQVIDGDSNLVNIDSLELEGNLPSTTTNKLYRQGSNLYWNGGVINTSGNSGVFLANGGDSSAPSYSFTSDTNTGMYADVADTLRFATGGQARASINSTGLGVTGTVGASTGFKLGLTQWMDSSLNISNVGAISSGAISTTGGITSADHIETGSGTGGALALTDRYSPSTNDHLANIGWLRSSGGTYIGYGVKQSGSTDWKSTFDNFSGKRNYFAFDEDSFTMAYAPAQSTAVDSAVTGLTEKFKFYLSSGAFWVNGTETIDSSRNATLGTISSGEITSPKLNVQSAAYEGSIVFGSNNTWHSGIRQHDDGKAELRIWHKRSDGRIYIATNYDGEQSNLVLPTDGLVVNQNLVGIGNFGATTPSEKLHVIGNIIARSGTPKIAAVSTDNATNASLRAVLSSTDSNGMYFDYHPNSAVGFIDNKYPRTAGYVYGDIDIRQKEGSTMMTRMRFDNDAQKIQTFVDMQPHTIKLEDMNGTVGSRFGVYAWDDEFQITKRNTSSDAYIATLIAARWSDQSIVLNGSIGAGLTSWDTTNLRLDINGNASIRRGFALYLGVNSASYNSWQGRLRNSGSTMIVDSQAFQHTNSGYGSTTFFTSNSSGMNIATGGLLFNGTTVIDSSRNITSIKSVELEAYSPPTTTNKLYNVAGTLYWNGQSVATSTSIGVVRANDGSASAPSYSFASDTNTGMYSDIPDGIRWAVGGQAKMSLVSTGLGVTGTVGASTGYKLLLTQWMDSNLNISNVGTISSGAITSPKLNVQSGAYEGSIVFGSNNTWHCGIRQHDDADAEMRIWHKNSNGMIFLATGYDGEPASISRPTDGLVVQGNKVGIGNFSSVDPQSKLHIKSTSDTHALDIDSSGTNSVKIGGTGSLKMYSYHDSGGFGWATGTGVSWDNLVYLDPTNDLIRLYTAQGERLRVGANDVQIKPNTLYLGPNNRNRLSGDNNGEFGINYNTTSGTAATSLVVYNNTTPKVRLYRNGRIRNENSVSAKNESVQRAAHFSQSGSSTGAILIQLPGNRSTNWSMAVFRITTYEYTGNAHNVYYVSGHDWTSGWYNNGATHQGTGEPESVKLVNNTVSNKQGILIGSTSEGRSYLHVTVDIMSAPSFYTNNMDFQGTWAINLVTNIPNWSDNGGNLVKSHLKSGAGNKHYNATSTGRLYFGGNAFFERENANSIKHENSYGHIQFGPLNSSGAHIYTDRDRFYFNKIPSFLSNSITSYNGDLTIFREENSSHKLTLSTTGITATGNVTAYSDERLKENIKTLDGSKVYDMRGVSFTKDGHDGSGVIAQELEQVAPELVHDGEYKSVAYGNLVGYLIEAVKGQKAMINDLTKRIEELENGNHKDD